MPLSLKCHTRTTVRARTGIQRNKTSLIIVAAVEIGFHNDFHFSVTIAWKVLGPLDIKLKNKYFRGNRRLAVSIKSEPIYVF